MFLIKIEISWYVIIGLVVAILTVVELEVFEILKGALFFQIELPSFPNAIVFLLHVSFCFLSSIYSSPSRLCKLTSLGYGLIFKGRRIMLIISIENLIRSVDKDFFKCRIEGNYQRIRIRLLSNAHCIFELYEVISMLVCWLCLLNLMRVISKKLFFRNEYFS